MSGGRLEEIVWGTGCGDRPCAESRRASYSRTTVPPHHRTPVPPNYSGCVKNFYKSDEKTGLNDAENGSEFTTGQFAEKNAKMRGVDYLADWQSLSSYLCL